MNITHVLKDGTVHRSIEGRMISVNNGTLSIYSTIKDVLVNISEESKKNNKTTIQN